MRKNVKKKRKLFWFHTQTATTLYLRNNIQIQLHIKREQLFFSFFLWFPLALFSVSSCIIKDSNQEHAQLLYFQQKHGHAVSSAASNLCLCNDATESRCKPVSFMWTSHRALVCMERLAV